MVAAIGAGADRLFEGEILAAAEIIEIADRRVPIGAVEQHAADDLDRGFQRDRIGRIPAGGVHGAEHVPDVADQPDIDRIAGNALRGPRHHRQVGEALLVLVMRPEAGQHQIGEQAIGDEDEQRERQRAPAAGRAFAIGGNPPESARHDRQSVALHSARSFDAASKNYRLVSRQPAASASSTEQNQRVPLLIFISIFAYQRLVGW